MNPRRNLQTRKNRRKRNERWELRGGVDEWISREIGRDINRFTRNHGIEIVRGACIEAMKDIDSGELVIMFDIGTRDTPPDIAGAIHDHIWNLS